MEQLLSDGLIFSRTPPTLLPDVASFTANLEAIATNQVLACYMGDFRAAGRLINLDVRNNYQENLIVLLGFGRSIPGVSAAGVFELINSSDDAVVGLQDIVWTTAYIAPGSNTTGSGAPLATIDMSGVTITPVTGVLTGSAVAVYGASADAVSVNTNVTSLQISFFAPNYPEEEAGLFQDVFFCGLLTQDIRTVPLIAKVSTLTSVKPSTSASVNRGQPLFT